MFRLYRPEAPELSGYEVGDRSAGAYHSGDLAFAFNNVGVVGVGWDDRDRELSEELSSYWVNFARTGNPNGDRLPEWPAYDETGEQAIEFATSGTAPTSKVRADKLNLFNDSYQVGGN